MAERFPAAPADMISIKVSIWDSGCLPTLLSSEISNVERLLKALGTQLSSSDAEQNGAYLGQLRACLSAVEEARRG